MTIPTLAADHEKRYLPVFSRSFYLSLLTFLEKTLLLNIVCLYFPFLKKVNEPLVFHIIHLCTQSQAPHFSEDHHTLLGGYPYVRQEIDMHCGQKRCPLVAELCKISWHIPNMSPSSSNLQFLLYFYLFYKRKKYCHKQSNK